MEERFDADLNLIQDNINQDEETVPLKFDINKESLEEKKRLHIVLQNLEVKLGKYLKEEEKSKNGEKKEKLEVQEVQEEQKEQGSQVVQVVQGKKEEEKKLVKFLSTKTDILIMFIEQRHQPRYRWFLFSIFSIYLPLFTTINLIGIFQIISVMNAVFEVTKRSIICYLNLEDKEDLSYYEFYHFYGFYINFSVDEGIDYDLIETMSFLGIIFVKFYGFSVSSGFFMLLNIISLFMLLIFFGEFNETYETFTILEIIYLIICYILLFVGVGSSALLSQQLLIDNYEKYSSFLRLVDDDKKNKDKTNEEEKIQEPYFVLVCVTSIIGFLAKYFFNILIFYKKNSFDEQYEIDTTDIVNNESNTTNTEANLKIYEHDKFLFVFIIVIYGGSILISIILYRIFKQVYEGDLNSEEKIKKKEKKRECNIFGYIIYLKKYNNKELKYENEQNQENKDDLNINGERNSLNSRHGSVTVSQIIGANDDDKNKNSCEPKKKENMFKRSAIYCKECFMDIFLCLRLASDSLISFFDEIICNYFCFCCRKKCCCCCCFECCISTKIEKEDYELNDGYICYCYTAKRNMKWFNRFIRDETQIKLMPLLLQYFIIQLNTVAFDKIFEENNEEGYNEFTDSLSIFIFILIFGTSLFLFFYLTISFGNLYNFFSKGTKEKLEKEKPGDSTGKLSNKILNGTYGILIFNGFYNFFLSIICLGRDIKNNNCFYIPILINKFYFFTFAHQCTIYTDDDDEINYFTVATLLSIYLFIWDFIIEQIKKIPTIGLLYFQIVLSGVIVVASLFVLVILLFFIGRFLFTLLYFISFLCSFGGFWFIKCCYEKKDLEKKECDKFDNEEKLYKLFCGKDNYEKLKEKLVIG